MPEPALGGARDPLDGWDFFDVTGDQSVDLADTLDVLGFFGDPALPATPGDLRDRMVPDGAQPWQAAEASASQSPCSATDEWCGRVELL